MRKRLLVLGVCFVSLAQMKVTSLRNILKALSSRGAVVKRQPTLPFDLPVEEAGGKMNMSFGDQ